MTGETKQYVPVFLASTFSDMQEYRKAVWDQLEKLQVAVQGMELFGARTATPLETCISEVRKSEIFIALIGMRRGSVVEDTGMSFVETEYAVATDEKLTILIYLIDEERAKIPPVMVDRGGEEAKQLDAFKERLRKRHTCESYASPQELAEKVQRDLLNVLEERGSEVDTDKLAPTEETSAVVDLLSSFNLMPARYSREELEMVVAPQGKPSAVARNMCEALGLSFGQAVSRKIRVVEPPDLLSTYGFLSPVYGDYENADILVNTPAKNHLRVLVQLKFAEIADVMGSGGGAFNILGDGIWDPVTGATHYRWIEHRTVKAVVLKGELPHRP
jgi:hypothetical protein